MNKEAKEKILTALRNKQYRQNLHHLYSPSADAYCVLGVICDVSKEGTWDKNGYYRAGTSQSGTVLPHRVMDWAGFKTRHPFVEHPDAPEDIRNKGLASLNDKGYTFEQLAEIIELYF